MNIPVYPPPIQPKRQRLTVFFMLMMACSFIQLVPVFAVLMVVLEKPLYQLLKAMEAGQISEETFSQMLTAMMEWWMDKPIVTIATLFGTAGIVGVFVIWQLTMRQRPLSEWGIKGGKKGIAQYALGLVLGCALFMFAGF